MLPALVLSAALTASEVAPSEVDRLRGYLAVAKGHGGLMYRLAQALARAGQAEEAVRWLKAGLDQGLDFDLGDAAFGPLRERSDFKEQLARSDALRPVAKSRVAFRVPEPDLIPEGIAWDPQTGDFFVGSLHRKKIVRVDATGRARDFVPEGTDGLEDVLGLEVDAPRRLLWVCTAASPRAGAAAGASGLFAYEVDTGRRRSAHWLREAGARHLLNDLEVTRAGEVFVTDSDGDAVYRLRPGGDRLELLVGPGTFRYPNGIALAADEKRLYVADFEHGLSVFDLASGALEALPHPADVSPHGIDGLYRAGGDLVAVQNGAGRERILRYRLSPGGDRIESAEVLESRNPFFRIPTTGVVTSDGFVYLANANLEALDEEGRVKKDARLEEVVVLRVPLS